MYGLFGRHDDKVRFLLVGVWNTVFGLAVVWMLDRLIPYDVESVVQKELVFGAAWIISISQNYFTFKLLVFRTQGNWLREYGRMYVTYALVFVVQSILVLAISQAFDLSVFWASLPTIIVVTVMSYAGHKYFTFRQPDTVFRAGGE
ncbi:MAG: GtrA family protein [Coriobacteriia bacterium]